MTKVASGARWNWLFIALVMGLLLRAVPLLEKQYFTGDELRAYLAATAHQGAYRQIIRTEQPPIGEWTPVPEWTRLVRPEPGLGLHAVAQDLAWYDVHPPLYFWLLHLWLRLVGVTFWAGALLNLLLEGLILWVLVRWGQRFFSNPMDAYWWGAIWWLSPVVIRAAPLTRQYVLLTLITLLAVYAFTQLFDQPSSRWVKVQRATIFGALLLVGMLTHYLFVLVIGTSMIALAVKHSGPSAQWLLYLGIPLGLAAVLFVWVYPDFLLAFTFLQEARPDFWSGLGYRFGRSLIASGALFLPLGLGWLLLAVESLSTRFPTVRSEPGTLWRQMRLDRIKSPLVLFALVPTLGVDLLYLLLISPHHAMGPHYLLFCTPFIAGLTVCLLSTAVPSPRLLSALVGFLVALNLILLHPALRNFGVPPRLNPADLQTDGVVVFDHPASIHWLNFALHLPEDRPVYVATQADLLALPDRWLPRLRSTGGLYLAWTLFNPQKDGATVAQQTQLLHLIQAEADLQLRVIQTPLSLGELRIFQITPR